MSDFNKIRYRAVIEFLTPDGERSSAADAQSNDRCLWWKIRRHMPQPNVGAAEFRRGRTSLEDDPRPGRPSDAVCEENCHTVENIVMQNRRVNVHQIADTVGISTGSVKTILHEHLVYDKGMCTMGPQNAWPENEGLSMRNIECKFETHAVELGFVHAAHSNRWWDLDTPLWPWDQTTKYAVEACQFSKPPQVQGAGISW